MNQAKQAAARSWRSTLSSGGEAVQEKDDKTPSDAEDKEGAQKPEQQGDWEKDMANDQDMLSVQRQAQDARCVLWVHIVPFPRLFVPYPSGNELLICLLFVGRRLCWHLRGRMW